MTNSPSIKKNYLYDTLYHAMTFFIPLVTSPYISRVLGAEGVGDFSYLISIQAYFSMFTALGTATYGARVIARSRDNRTELSKNFWEIELLTVLISVITIFAWLVLSLLYDKYESYMIILTLCIISTALDISWFFAGVEQYKTIALRNTFFKFVGLIGMFVFVKTKNDLWKYFFLHALISLLSSASLWIKINKYIYKINFEKLEIKKHFRETLVYFVPTVATSIYTVLDKTLIGLITKESTENGYYEQANQIINIAKTISFGSINTVLGTRMSYLHAKGEFGNIRSILKLSFDFVLLVSFGSVFGIVGIAKDFVPLYFGNGFEPVENLLYILSPIIIIISISSCLGVQYYIPFGKRRESAKYIIFGSLINLIFNLIFIPVYKSYGAALSSIIAECLISYLYLTHCDGIITVGEILHMGWKKLISGMIMFLCICNLPELLNISSKIIMLFIQVTCGICIYAIALILLRDHIVLDGCNKIKSFIGTHYCN